MANENLTEVVDPADPRRCKGATRYGQCGLKAGHGSEFCPIHNNHSSPSDLVVDRKMYFLNEARYRQRLSQLSEHDDIKSLREEIALTRVLIETKFNQAEDEADLLASCSVLNSLLLTVERLVKTCHQMEQSLGSLLAKSTVVALGQKIVEILADELQGIESYEDRIDSIINRLFPAISAAADEPKLVEHKR